MDWQQAISLAIVVLAAVLLAWGRFRRRRFSFEREAHCGCSTVGEPATQSSIIFRARKGERAQVVVKMK